MPCRVSLMFFSGIIMCVGGLGALGYLAIGSELLYGSLGATSANILVGVASAIVLGYAAGIGTQMWLNASAFVA
jgi:Na+/H+ antiporter NhaD/arsenite permease-like protein